MIGAGNVGSHLATGLAGAGHHITSVFSRTISKAKRLAHAVQSTPVTSFENTGVADVYIIAVRDDAIGSVSTALIGNIPAGAIVAHTAASVPQDALSEHRFYGVFYPLQTFTTSRDVDLGKVPFLISGSDRKTESQLISLASGLSQTIVRATDEQRAVIHVSATIACNFSNHMYAISERLMKNCGLDYDLLRPLITETARKGTDMSPVEAQTGPASRGDTATMKRHLALLEASGVDITFYKVLSQSIQDFVEPGNHE